MADYAHLTALLRAAVSLLTAIDEHGEDCPPDPAEVRAATWRVADAAALLRAGLEADGFVGLVGLDRPTGRGALLPALPDVRDPAPPIEAQAAPVVVPAIAPDVISAPGGWVLVDSDGRPALRGATVQNAKGETFILTGGMPPRHASSSGRVYLRDARAGALVGECYPGVIGHRWLAPLDLGGWEHYAAKERGAERA